MLRKNLVRWRRYNEKRGEQHKKGMDGTIGEAILLWAPQRQHNKHGGVQSALSLISCIRRNSFVVSIVYTARRLAKKSFQFTVEEEFIEWIGAFLSSTELYV